MVCNSESQEIKMKINLINGIKRLDMKGQKNQFFFTDTLFSVTHLTIKNNTVFLIKNLVYFPNLVTLVMNENNLKFKSKYLFSFMKLQYLDLSSNLIKSINHLNNFKLSNLYYLDLSKNPFDVLDSKFFSSFNNLRFLKITHCSLLSINDFNLGIMKNLMEFHMNNTKYNSKQLDLSIIKSKNLKIFFGNSFKTCCLIWKYISRQTVCFPSSSLYNTCSYLLKNTYIKFLFWFFGIFGTLANFSSLFPLFLEKNPIWPYRISIIICDGLSSIYMLIIAIVDTKFKNEFIEKSDQWMNSVECIMLGTIMIFSQLFSCVILFLLTYERFQAINNPLLKSNLKKRRRLIIMFSFVISLFIAILPLIIFEVNS